MSLANLIEIATNEKQTEDDWTKILDVCEKGAQNSKECLRLILRRLFNKNPHIVLRSIIVGIFDNKILYVSMQLLDACVQNIGEPFTKELSSRYFVNEIKSKSKNIHQKALERLCFMMKKWSRELTGGEYDCINELNKWLQDTYPIIYAAGDDELNSRNSNKMNRKNLGGQEDDDLAKAIALSLKESEQKRSNLYPSNINHAIANTTKLSTENVVAKKQLPKVRALYDFEAVEDNELTFKAGEIIIDVDTSNEHWWYGSNHRGQGMFPAQFVTTDLDNDVEKGTESTKAANDKNPVQINQQTDIFSARPPTPVIDESKVDECILLIEDADPTGELRPDPPELAKLEAQCRVMGPLIDQELEKVDRHYNMLVELNRKIIDSFQLYNELMTQGGMSRPTNYMWPQNMPGAHAQYTSMPLQDPSQMIPSSSQIPANDPMMYQTMNYYGNMNRDSLFGSQQFAVNKNQQLPNRNYPATTHINQKPNFPNNSNNNAVLPVMNFQDLRSLPLQNNYSENSFQSLSNMTQPHFSYVQNDQTFPTTDGFH